MSDHKAAATNFLNALDRIPKLTEQYRMENEKLEKDLPTLREVVGGTWKKEDELKLLKSEMAVLERKIRLELVPLEKNMEKGETDMKQKQSPQILLSSIENPEQPSSQHTLVERSVSQTKSFRL